MKTIAYIDCRARDEVVDKLKYLGYDVVLVQKNSSFEEPISAHADMNIFFLNNIAFSSTNVRIDEKYNQRLITRKGDVSLIYPDDAFLNCVALSDDLICNKKNVAPEILDCAESLGCNIINVRQGYTKCNIAVVSETFKAVITEDKGIHKTLTKAGYDVLLLKSHSANLHPYSYGFIGGSCGLHDNVLYFNGNIFLHPEIDPICNFCKEYGVEICALSDGPLEDCGSILFS